MGLGGPNPQGSRSDACTNLPYGNAFWWDFLCNCGHIGVVFSAVDGGAFAAASGLFVASRATGFASSDRQSPSRNGAFGLVFKPVDRPIENFPDPFGGLYRRGGTSGTDASGNSAGAGGNYIATGQQG